MMTPSKNYLKIFFFGFLLFSFTACQTGISEELDQHAAPQLAEPTEDEESPCYGQEPEQGFDLERATITTTPTALGTPQTVGHLELIPDHHFSVANSCMCYVDRYVITFDEYPDPANSSYTNNAGVQIYPIAIDDVLSPGPGPQTIVAYNVKFDHADLDEGIYFAFDPGLSPQPMLEQAGGLCMVDNVGAPIPTATDRSIGPWEVIVTDRNGAPSTRYGIPTTKSSGTHRLVAR